MMNRKYKKGVFDSRVFYMTVITFMIPIQNMYADRNEKEK